MSELVGKHTREAPITVDGRRVGTITVRLDQSVGLTAKQAREVTQAVADTVGVLIEESRASLG
jgi:hypothetical protein